MTAVIVIGAVGALVLVLACLVDDRAATAATQTTAARGTPPVAPRVAVTQPSAGRHRR